METTQYQSVLLPYAYNILGSLDDALYVAQEAVEAHLKHGPLWDFNVLNKGYVYGILQHLGYPVYLAAILGVAKLLAAVVILSPDLSLLKEWAHAGLVILFGGTFLSHMIIGDPLSTSVFALIFCIIVFRSWLLRPESRKLLA